MTDTARIGHQMRDDQAHFFIAIADLCAAANLAELPVDVVTVSDERVSGIPSAPPTARRPAEELDDTGYARAVLIDDTVIDLTDVHSLCITVPPGPVDDR